MAKVISATTASRSFSEVLDEVEHRGEEYVIERHGRVVARLAPAGTTRNRVTWGEARQALLSGPRPDPGFAKDLAWIRRHQGKLPTKDPWERYSTRRS